MQIKEHMLDYVINLLEDANDFSWASTKASHAVFLCQMEQGEVVGWSDVEKIDRIRRAHAQRHISQQSAQGKAHEKNGKQPTKFVACVYFNKNMCSQTKRIMKPKVSIIGIFVRCVGKRIVKCIHIHRWIAEDQRQKTNEAGHVENSSSCLEN